MISVQRLAASFQGGQGTQTFNLSATFQSAVESAEVALQGFDFSFPDGQNHQILNTQVQPLVSEINGNTVTVQVTVLMNDDSNHFAGGNVSVLVVANLSEQ